MYPTCPGHAENDCSSNTDLRAFESEAVIHSATVDGPVDMPAVPCSGLPDESQTLAAF